MSEHKEAPEKPVQPEQPEPLEPTEQPEEQEQPEHHPARQSSGSSGTFLALLLATVAIIGALVLWQKQQALHMESQVLQQSVGRLLDMVEQSHDEQMQQLAKHRHPATEAQLEQTAAVVQELRGRLGQERQEYFITEMEYLLRTASHRLTLEHDRKTALAALGQARQRLASQELGFYQPVIQQIDKDIANITAVTLPDRNRIATELATLIDAAEHWPFAVRLEETTQQAPADQPEPAEQVTEDGMPRVLDRIWQDIKGLVTIRHNGEVARPLLQPNQRYFLQQNMQLKLQAARLALLAGNDQAYRDSLSEAAQWMTRYFDTSSLPVSEAQSTIEQLAAIELSPELPTLGNSLALLHQAAMKIRPQTETPPVPITPTPPQPEAAQKKGGTESAKPAPSAPAQKKESTAPDEQERPTQAGSNQQKKEEAPPPEENPATDIPDLPQSKEQ